MHRQRHPRRHPHRQSIRSRIGMGICTLIGIRISNGTQICTRNDFGMEED